MTLIIDAGHVDKVDPGACANGTTEHAEVVGIMQKLMSALSHTTIPYKTVPTGLTLIQKIGWVNQNSSDKDVLISLHLNSASPEAVGSMIYYMSGSNVAKEQAEKFIDTYCKGTGQKNRGADGDMDNRHGRLGIVRDTKPLAFLIELGFITNKKDLEDVRTFAVNGLTQAIYTLFQYKPMPEQPVNQTPSDVHAAAVAEAIKLGITNGDRPHDNATREEVFHMLVNLYHLLKK